MKRNILYSITFFLLFILSCEQNRYERLMDYSNNSPKINIPKLLASYDVDTSFVIDNYIIPNKLNFLTRMSDLEKENIFGKVKNIKIFETIIDSNESRVIQPPILLYEYYYNTHGNLTKTIFFDSTGSIESYTIYKYSIKFNSMEKLKYNSSDSLTNHQIHYYNQNGKEYLIEHILPKRKYYSHTFINYNKYGMENFRIYFHKNLVGIKIKEYNKSNNILKEEYYSSDGMLYNSTQYVYNDDGNIKTKRDYHSGELFSTETYQYLSGGYYSRSNFGNTKNEIWSVYRYGPNDLVTEIIDYEKGEIKKIYKYKYDQENNRIAQNIYDKENYLLEKIIEKNLEFDKYGNWTKNIYISSNGRVEIRKRVFKYF